MTELTKKVQCCGQHSDCDGFCTGDKEVFTISYKETKKAIKEVKIACAKAAEDAMRKSGYMDTMVIEAIRSVE